MTAPLTHAATRLRSLLEGGEIVQMPATFDPLSARLVEEAGFAATFMSGFAVSAARLALPDTGLISYGEIVDQGRNICAAVDIPVIGDGDTGYGNAVNVKRTVRGYAQAGFAAVMIEDQLWPKRCGHTKGKAVVGFDEAVARIRAACDARDEGAGILILARTDARATHGMDEALRRAEAFKQAGADMLFVEAPENEVEMRRICEAVPGWHLANMVEQGKTPVLPAADLQEIGYALVAWPLTLLSASMRAMRATLADMQAGRHPDDRLLDFAELRRIVGFEDYYVEDDRYAGLREN
ncbi:MAG: isocitrate lyase/PEP mutase family protein [Rhodospirillales bacterium]|nr:MAG: isocitrate lyase/PEP mutase family protein [Rhodospirillales bacterium]